MPHPKNLFPRCSASYRPVGNLTKHGTGTRHFFLIRPLGRSVPLPKGAPTQTSQGASRLFICSNTRPPFDMALLSNEVIGKVDIYCHGWSICFTGPIVTLLPSVSENKQFHLFHYCVPPKSTFHLDVMIALVQESIECNCTAVRRWKRC